MRPRFAVIVPCFDNPATVVNVIERCLKATDCPVLVVDDGSRVPVATLSQGSAAQDAMGSRVRILRSPRNRGKGHALRRGFDECIRRGYTHAITIDADGQHLPEDIPRLIRAAEESPWSLIIGVRNLESSTVPKVSRFGRSFSNFWVDYQTGASVRDSQSGLRVYPLYHVQNRRFWTCRYDFEIEILIRLLWSGVSVREVSVSAVYPPGDQRVSHFRKFVDNARISLLNTLLVGATLVRSRVSPRMLGWAVGAGVLIGCTPLFGLHWLVAGLVALLFRMNLVALWLGTQISLPPLAPAVAWLCINVGARLSGRDAPLAFEISWRHVPDIAALWLVGSIPVGVVLGAGFGVTTWLAASALARPRPAWNGRTRGGRFGNGFLKLVLSRFGLTAGYRCLYVIVPYFYLFAPRARRSSSQFWSALRPEATWLQRQAAIQRHLMTFARILMDRLYQTLEKQRRFFARSNGFENLRAPLTAGRGVIILSAHSGAWDLAASYIHRHDVGRPLHLIQYGAAGLTLEKVKASAEPRHNEIHYVNQEELPILRIHGLIRDGNAVGFMGDRPLGRHYELIPFLGRLAPFDTTAFRIALACQTPVILSFAFRERDGSYTFFAKPEIRPEWYRGIPRDEACLEMAKTFARTLEGFVRRYPEQWLNFYPFWSTLPQAVSADEHERKARRRADSAEAARKLTPVEAG